MVELVNKNWIYAKAKIHSTIYDVLEKEIPNKAYFEMLCELLQSGKRRYRKAEDYDLKVKLVRFATSRGFASDIVFRGIEHVGLDFEEPYD